MATQVILLERVDNLGELGDVVTVKPGFARNYLLPQQKALRANKANIAYFEAQKKHIEAENDKTRKTAENDIKTLETLTVDVIRAASESGQLYGSVTARDIANAIVEASKVAVERSQVELNQNFKELGLFPITIALHPEVKTDVTVNIARNDEEAAIQRETGRAITEEAPVEEETEAESLIDEENLSAALEDDALEAEKARAEEEAEAAAEAEAKAAEKAAAKAEKEAAKAAEAEEASEEEEAKSE